MEFATDPDCSWFEFGKPRCDNSIADTLPLPKFGVTGAVDTLIADGETNASVAARDPSNDVVRSGIGVDDSVGVLTNCCAVGAGFPNPVFALSVTLGNREVSPLAPVAKRGELRLAELEFAGSDGDASCVVVPVD